MITCARSTTGSASPRVSVRGSTTVLRGAEREARGDDRDDRLPEPADRRGPALQHRMASSRSAGRRRRDRPGRRRDLAIGAHHSPRSWRTASPARRSARQRQRVPDRDVVSNCCGERSLASRNPGACSWRSPELGDRLFASLDGDEWGSIASRTIPPRELAITATLRTPGYYLAANQPARVTGPTEDDSSSALVIGVVVAGVAALMFLGVYLVVRKRRRAVHS